MSNYKDPTVEMLENPIWLAIWREIKKWDINVPSEYRGYSGATGNHVTAIFKAIQFELDKICPHKLKGINDF